MVEPQSDDTGKRRGRYHDAPAVIKAVEGVRVRHLDFDDEYTGTAAALIETGLLAADQFPGQPGMPKGSVRYARRPADARLPYEGTYGEGSMEVVRKANGTFRVRLKVSDEEHERREDVSRAEQARRLGPVSIPDDLMHVEPCEQWSTELGKILELERLRPVEAALAARPDARSHNVMLLRERVLMLIEYRERAAFAARGARETEGLMRRLRVVGRQA